MKVFCTNRGHGNQNGNPLVVGNEYTVVDQGTWPDGHHYYGLAEFPPVDFGKLGLWPKQFDQRFFSPLPDATEEDESLVNQTEVLELV